MNLTITLLLYALLLPSWSLAQQNSPGNAAGTNSPVPADLQNVPNAPMPQNAQSSSATPPAPVGGITLSLKDAQEIALKNNPTISVARLNALASRQVTREVRSNLWPTATVDLTAVDANPGTRITAGALNNPVIYQRAAAGATVSQLITDFGHTTNLVASANLSAKAEEQDAIATKEQILLAVDQAFYSALQARDVLTVAQQTVGARQTVADQIQALFNSKLKSQLDFSFANVNLAQAKLLFLDAQNNENASLATLSMVLGYSNIQGFKLVEDTTSIAQPPANVEDLITQAFATRPEMLSLNFQYESAQKFQSAQRDSLLPTIRAVGAVGDTPVRNPLISSWYGAVGVNVDIPIFNGFLYTARAREAALREQATQERAAELRNRIARDVRTSWLNANTAYQRVDVTQQLLNQASLALDLAQTRYNLGLSSIVELSQAQLQQTQAQISSAQAGYDYRLALAVLRYETIGI
jgi:outer membrane protein